MGALWRGFARIRERGRRKEEGRTGKKKNRRGVGRRRGVVGILLRHFLA